MLAMALTAVQLLLFAMSQTPSRILMAQALNNLTFPLICVAGPLLEASGERVPYVVFGAGSLSPGWAGALHPRELQDALTEGAVKCSGYSSQTRPSSNLPAFFLCTPPHCLKKKGTDCARH
jgi:hypothetical protein